MDSGAIRTCLSFTATRSSSDPARTRAGGEAAGIGCVVPATKVGQGVIAARAPRWSGGRRQQIDGVRGDRPARTYERIYRVVARIPRGRVATYGQVASLAGLPHAPRIAGYALHAMPPNSPIPWHRVVAAGGRLSLARIDASSALTQRLRLEREGVSFDARGRVVLERFLWRQRPGARVRRLVRETRARTRRT